MLYNSAASRRHLLKHSKYFSIYFCSGCIVSKFNMAETWEIILWVIVAAAIVILLAIAIATFIVWRKRNRRKKNVKYVLFK